LGQFEEETLNFELKQMAHVATITVKTVESAKWGEQQSSALRPPAPPKGMSNQLLPRQKHQKREYPRGGGA